MEQQTQPTKEQVRQYLEQRQSERTPPPSIQEIRRQLGWTLLRNASSALDSSESSSVMPSLLISTSEFA